MPILLILLYLPRICLGISTTTFPYDSSSTQSGTVFGWIQSKKRIAIVMVSKTEIPYRQGNPKQAGRNIRNIGCSCGAFGQSFPKSRPKWVINAYLPGLRCALMKGHNFFCCVLLLINQHMFTIRCEFPKFSYYLMHECNIWHLYFYYLFPFFQHRESPLLCFSK